MEVQERAACAWRRGRARPLVPARRTRAPHAHARAEGEGKGSCSSEEGRRGVAELRGTAPATPITPRTGARAAACGASAHHRAAACCARVRTPDAAASGQCDVKMNESINPSTIIDKNYHFEARMTEILHQVNPNHT